MAEEQEALRERKQIADGEQSANNEFLIYLKFTFNTAIVTTTDNVTNIMVKSRYLPNRGTVNDVGGMISARSRKKTVNDSRMLMHREIFSPESLGK